MNKKLIMLLLSGLLLSGCANIGTDENPVETNTPNTAEPANTPAPTVAPTPKVQPAPVTPPPRPTATPEPVMIPISDDDLYKIGLASDIGNYEIKSGVYYAMSNLVPQLESRDVCEPVSLNPIVTAESTPEDFQYIADAMISTIISPSVMRAEITIADDLTLHIMLRDEFYVHEDMHINEDGLWAGRVVYVDDGRIREEDYIWDFTGMKKDKYDYDKGVKVIGGYTYVSPYYHKICKTLEDGLGIATGEKDIVSSMRVINGHVVIDLEGSRVHVHGISLQEDGKWKGLYDQEGQYQKIFVWTPPGMFQLQKLDELD